MEKLYISNSMLRDWEEMCPIAWKARWIDKTIEWPETDAMRWGVFFEQTVLGCGVGGKTVELTDKEKKSVYYERTLQQAAACKRYLKLLGGKIVGVQQYHRVEIQHQDQIIPIMGGLDIEYQLPGGAEVIIDLKYTADTDNTFGKFAWGAPERMDCSQMIHYALIKRQLTGQMPMTQYWVFDKSAAMQQKLLNVNIDETAIYDHLERISRAYNEIQAALFMDTWTPKNTYANCSTCPLKGACDHERIMPEVIEINAWVPQPTETI